MACGRTHAKQAFFSLAHTQERNETGRGGFGGGGSRNTYLTDFLNKKLVTPLKRYNVMTTFMALTNSQRQKRWRENNRALFNLRRRQARNLKAIDNVKKRLHELHELRDSVSGARQREHAPKESEETGGAPSRPLFETKKVGEFRMVVIPESDESVATDSKPRVFRNDYGAIISESAWKRLQEMKRHAKENNFEMDDYSQNL